MQAVGEQLPFVQGDDGAGAGAARRSGLWPIYLLFLLLVLMVAGGAWWLAKQQRRAPPPQLPAEEVTAIPVPAPPAGPTSEPSSRVGPEAPGSGEGAQPVAPEGRGRPAVRPSAPAEAGVGRAAFPAEDLTDEPLPITGPDPQIVYRPETNRGRVVQLGAFPTRAQAEDAYQAITRRYPYLTTRTKMINTLYVQPLGGGRGTRMYRLQLGTSSQAQSVVICQQLEKAGHSCVVVY